MPQIFVYIAHRDGVVDDSAAELLAAAQKIDGSASPIALVAGSGAELDSVCNSLRSSCNEVWKIGHEALAYPNAELIRKALVKVLPPPGSIGGRAVIGNCSRGCLAAGRIPAAINAASAYP